MTSPYEKMPCGHLGRFEMTNPLEPESPVLCALCEIKRLESELAEAKKQAAYWQESAEDWKSKFEGLRTTVSLVKSSLEQLSCVDRYLATIIEPNLGKIEFAAGEWNLPGWITTPWDFAQAALDKVFGGAK